MNRIYGVLPAIVTNVDDPEGTGKVEVSFPSLPEIDEKPWASIATLMGGKERGSYFMPEVSDECLVSFDRGDFEHPYIVGFLWNGIDKPPEKEINKKVRRIRTVSGHRIDFDDNDGKEKIHVKSKGEHEIVLNDAEKKIFVKTSNGHQIEMSDDSSGFVKIKTAADQVISLDDGGPSITMQNTGNTITLDSSGIKLEASAEVSIKGATVVIDASGQLTAKGVPIHLNP